MPAHPTTTNPQSTPNEARNPRKRQARLDDNGEPAGVPRPVAKRVKSAGQNGQKKKLPAKTRRDNPKNLPKAVARPPKKTSVEKEVVNDSDDTMKTNDGTNLPEPDLVESSDEEGSVIEIDDEPEEDDEAELGMSRMTPVIK